MPERIVLVAPRWVCEAGPSLMTTLRAELFLRLAIAVLFSALFVCVNSLGLLTPLLALAISAIFLLI